MPLPSAKPRQQLHTRQVEYRGYLRDDGLWDIEAQMTDIKTYAIDRSDGSQLAAGQPVHNMHIRVTVDDEMVIREIATAMDDTPYAECGQGVDPMQKMVGTKMGPGWRVAIERALGGVQGCTHLRELLFNMATAGYQTIPVYIERQRLEAGGELTDHAVPPSHLGKCISWDFAGPVVARIYPQFSGWVPVKRMDKPGTAQ